MQLPSKVSISFQLWPNFEGKDLTQRFGFKENFKRMIL